MDRSRLAEAEKHFYLDILSWSLGYLINLALILIGAYVAFRYMRSEEQDNGRSKQDDILLVCNGNVLDSSRVLGRDTEDPQHNFHKR